MNDSTDRGENHDITIKMQDSIDSMSKNATSSPKVVPLSNNSSLLNSIEKHSKGSPSKARFSRSPRRFQKLKPDNESSVDSFELNADVLQQHQQQTSKQEYDELERRFADTLLKYEHIKVDNQRLIDELHSNQEEIDSLKSHIKLVEQTVVDMESEKHGIQEAFKKNESMYRKVVETLQNKVEDLSSQLSISIAPSVAELRDRDNNLVHKYEKLLRDYKVLQHQYEVEKSSKLVLMDQIEFLAHKNEELVNQLESPITDDLESEDKSIDQFINHATHTMNEIANEEEEDEEEGGDVCEEFYSEKDGTSDSIKVTSHFQFPPSPDPQSKERKRQSLPTNFASQSIPQPNEFVLSPFKLTPGVSSSTTEDKDAMFDNPDNSIVKRYSKTKPTHTRYNSHDILPIKVEFEPDSVRYTSMPEKVHRQDSGFDVIEESFVEDYAKLNHRDGTFFALNGTGSEDTGFDTSKRMSYDDFDSSSKRSSYINADNKTRQEVTKLKFELQSLKLHNEKLLSYIGFELQKQKKNIKKLAKKQSSNSMRALNKQMEYSDAKLIEESKNMLINKKRVLRSVSINAVFNKNEKFATNPVGINHAGVNNGELNAAPEVYSYDEESNDQQSESNFVNDKIVKKFASQIFRPNDLYSLSEDEADSDFENDTWELGADGEDDTNLNEEYYATSSSSSSSDEELNMLHKIRSYVMGPTKDSKSKSKRRSKDDLVDDNLKFKFLTIALGIAIIGLKLTPKSQQMAIGQ
ncbi:hypothetical protein CANMA_002779 [Candida margitis]|uniref:uncharacterized protein n=1 Tax=Candida margitis TaxID=1775924 RepID=UPI0022273281|nr:uncharacterized protein CANMA_002779 [Candida margitis]KAI5968011.1 hypothetical protein CANMA_002779 [Candida margitis]